MKFNWSEFTEDAYYKYVNKRIMGVIDCEDYIGSVFVGDISIDLVDFGEEEFLAYDFYVAHEDTGYGYKNGIPYDYADGNTIDIPYELSYDEFKGKMEKVFKEYIEAYNASYSLVEHANRPLEIW